MTQKEYEVYRYLEQVAIDDPTKWVSKEELIAKFPCYFTKGEDSHDICSTLNLVRLRINEARAAGKVSHLVLLKDHHFKLCVSREEAEEHIGKDFSNAIKLLKRYWQNMGAIKEDGYGKLIDCNGNIITDESLAKRFQAPFEYELKSESHNLDKQFDNPLEQLDDLKIKENKTSQEVNESSAKRIIYGEPLIVNAKPIMIIKKTGKLFDADMFDIPAIIVASGTKDHLLVHDFGSADFYNIHNFEQDFKRLVEKDDLKRLITYGIVEVIPDYR